jgi:hypothetical protein
MRVRSEQVRTPLVTMSADRRDFLDEIIDERRERNPEFPDLVQAALERRAPHPERGVAESGPAADPTRLGEIGD